MSSNSLELLDEGRVFELVHHPTRQERRPLSCSSASTSTREGQKGCSKRAASAVTRSLEVLPPDTPHSPPPVPPCWEFPLSSLPPPLPSAAPGSSKGEEEEEEGEFPSHEDVGSGKGEVLDTPSLLSPDDKQGGCEVVEVEVGQGGSAEVDRLMSEIQEMHLVVQSLLKGSRVEEEEEEEEEGEEGREEDKHKVSYRVTSQQDFPATTSSEESSTSPRAKDPAGLSTVSSSTPQEEEEGREQVLKERKGREWEALLPGGEGELADRLRKAIAKMKKLDEKLASVTKRERELKLQRKQLEQQLAMLEAGTIGMPPLEYKGEGLGAGLEADSDGSTSPPIFPVFATEIHPISVSPTHTQLGRRGVRGGAGQVSETQLQQSWSGAAGGRSSGQLDQEGQREKRKNWRRKGIPLKQDFIQRNIQLASDAGSSVAMTEEEKKRLESLLLDSEEEEEEEGREEGDKAHHKQDHGCRTAVVAFTGFGVDAESTKRLRDIESHLTMYSGGEVEQMGDTLSMVDSSFCQSGHRKSTECGSVSGDMALSLAAAGRGDPMVERVRCERDDQLRMREIDAQLHLLQHYKDNEEVEEKEEEHSSRLTSDQLQALLAQCRGELVTTPQGALNQDDTG